jgi:cobalamin synthase
MPSTMHIIVVLAVLIATGSLVTYFFNRKHPASERTHPLGAALRTRYTSTAFMWLGALFLVFFLLQAITGGPVNYFHLLGLVLICFGWLSRKFTARWIEWERRRLE